MKDLLFEDFKNDSLKLEETKSVLGGEDKITNPPPGGTDTMWTSHDDPTADGGCDVDRPRKDPPRVNF